MAILKILPVQDPALHQKSKPVGKVDKKIQTLISDMKDTLLAQKDPLGVGLAAVQVGKPIRLFLVRDKGKILTMINPQILWMSEKTNEPPREKTEDGRLKAKKQGFVMEGCLSLLHYYGPVQRAASIKVRYFTPKILDTGYSILDTTTQTFSGFSAQIIQHEIDHLEGKTFVERLLEQGRQLFKLEKDYWVEVEFP